MTNIARRLDALERALGDDDGDDYGPTLVIQLTQYWRGAGDGGGDQLGKLREQQMIDAAVAEVAAEASARREHLAHIVVGCDHDGTVRIDGVPWRTSRNQALAEVPPFLDK